MPIASGVAEVLLRRYAGVSQTQFFRGAPVLVARGKLKFFSKKTQRRTNRLYET
jgi:hypothetical protein